MGLFDKWKKKETGAGDAIVAVVNGEMIPPEQISDPTFAKELMGQTIGFEPADGTIVSPCDGIVEVLYPTRHAFALRRADGTGILVHIGIDTVNLNGDGFTAFVSQGDRVRAGDRIVEVDLSALRAGCPCDERLQARGKRSHLRTMALSDAERSSHVHRRQYELPGIVYTV